MGVIYYFSSQSTTGIYPVLLPRFLFFKGLHLFEYAFLSFLLFFAFKKLHWTILISLLYSFSDELHQYFVPGRNARYSDILFDLAGILIGLIIAISIFTPKGTLIRKK